MLAERLPLLCYLIWAFILVNVIREEVFDIGTDNARWIVSCKPKRMNVPQKLELIELPVIIAYQFVLPYAGHTPSRKRIHGRCE